MEKIKIGTVSYLNAKPLIYGFENGMLSDQIELLADYPSAIAAQLLDGKIDIGLVPVAVIPQMKECHIIGNYCIGAVGPVASVCLFSDVPIHEIETILLDYQSRTSVELLKLLVRHYWKINPEYLKGEPGYESSVSGKKAALVIGDRAMLLRKQTPFVYDLSEAWMEMTGLPFVFAVWLSGKPLPDSFVAAFDQANHAGFENIDRIIAENPGSGYDLKEYYTRFISYRLDEDKKKGLNHFLSLIG